MALLLPLLPLRIALGGLALVAIAAINSAAAWNWPSDKPLTPWRRRMVLFSKELVLVTLWCIGFRVRVKGRENLAIAERLGAVGVFNHVSWIDAFVLVWLMAPSGVSKDSNAQLPVIGPAVRALQTVYIPYDKLSKRNAATAAAASVSNASLAPEATSALCSSSSCSSANSSPRKGAATTAAAAAATAVGPESPSCSGGSPPSPQNAFVVSSNVTDVLLRRVSDPSYCKPGGFPLLVMAPEGTTGNGRGLLSFRSGAFALRRPVLPICLRYRWRALNPAWTIGDSRWHFVRLMCQFRNDLEVEILPPYKPSKDELKDPKLFAANVRRLMASSLGVPLVAASHDDYLALVRRGVGVSWDGRRLTGPHGAPRHAEAPGAVGGVGG